MLVRVLVICLMFAMACPGHAGKNHSRPKNTKITTLAISPPLQQIGHEHRADYAKGLELIVSGEQQEGRALLEPIIAFCDAVVRKDAVSIAVSDASEYDEFVAGRSEARPVEWVDMVCPWSYKAVAFSEVESGRVAEALPYLRKADALAPFWAQSRVERGYVLVHLGRFAEGLAAYEEALALAKRYPSNREALPLAYRGMGYAYIELKDLDRAEEAYRKSLEIDPGNRTAQSELEYIKQQREKKLMPGTAE